MKNQGNDSNYIVNKKYHFGVFFLFGDNIGCVHQTQDDIWHKSVTHKQLLIHHTKNQLTVLNGNFKNFWKQSVRKRCGNITSITQL